MEIIVILLGISLLATFIILLIDKIGLRQKIAENSKYLIVSKLMECDFCLSFWIAVLICVILAIAFGIPEFLVLPIFTAPITRRLL